MIINLSKYVLQIQTFRTDSFLMPRRVTFEHKAKTTDTNNSISHSSSRKWKEITYRVYFHQN